MKLDSNIGTIHRQSNHQPYSAVTIIRNVTILEWGDTCADVGLSIATGSFPLSSISSSSSKTGMKFNAGAEVGLWNCDCSCCCCWVTVCWEVWCDIIGAAIVAEVLALYMFNIFSISLSSSFVKLIPILMSVWPLVCERKIKGIIRAMGWGNVIESTLCDFRIAPE